MSCLLHCDVRASFSKTDLTLWCTLISLQISKCDHHRSQCMDVSRVLQERIIRCFRSSGGCVCADGMLGFRIAHAVAPSCCHHNILGIGERYGSADNGVHSVFKRFVRHTFPDAARTNRSMETLVRRLRPTQPVQRVRVFRPREHVTTYVSGSDRHAMRCWYLITTTPRLGISRVQARMRHVMSTPDCVIVTGGVGVV